MRDWGLNASRLEQPVDPLHHVLMVEKFATIGGCNSLFDAGGKAGLIFQHTDNGVFHQLLGVLAIGKRHLLEPRFNVRREMNCQHLLHG
jgi:hypothetical protein